MIGHRCGFWECWSWGSASEVFNWSWDFASKCKVDRAIADPDASFDSDEEAGQEEPNPDENQNCRR